MTKGVIGRQQLDANRRTLLSAVSSADGETILAAEINASDNGILVHTTNSSSSSSTNANFYTGQTAVNTTQVQLTASSNSLSNGLRLKSLSTNSANIYYGLTGVTTSTGDTLEPGESVVVPINNTNLLYIISVASTTDKITWGGN